MESELSFLNRTLKRLFDFTVSFIGILLTWWLILIAYILATYDTKKSGFFSQSRVGKNGKHFRVIKIRTMRVSDDIKTNVTKKSDERITSLGAFFRKTKIDELPQLFNVFIGRMSFVGPRPDVPGFAEKLTGEDRKILSLSPGMTGPATLVFKNEEEILDQQAEPEKYNREVIYPQKAKLNLNYLVNYSFYKDLKYILATLFPALFPNITEDILNE